MHCPLRVVYFRPCLRDAWRCLRGHEKEWTPRPPLRADCARCGALWVYLSTMSQSMAEQIAMLSEDERNEIMADMDPDTILHDWKFWGRPEQFAPPGNWAVFLILSGRGFGKSRAGSEWVREKAMQNPGCRIIPEYFPSKRLLKWPNGSIAQLFSATEPDQLRGPQAHFAWCDEVAAFPHIPDASGLTAWDNARIATRLGDYPQLIATTTPKRVPVIKDLLKITDGSVVITRGSTKDNKGNLSSAYLDVIYGVYAGSHLASQELEGILTDEVEGALWTDDLLNAARTLTALPPLPFRVVAVDPSVSATPKDECGIVVVGATGHKKLHERHAYVLEDATIHGSPDVWARRVVETARRWRCPVVAEGNQGGDLVRMAIHSIDPSVQVFQVTARQNKQLRAEPVIAVYEQKRVHHVGYLPTLEAQQTSWVPAETKKSPDRCVARGTLIAMADGSNRPIQFVRPNDFVLTRNGARRVLASKRTSILSEVFNVTTQSGCNLTATANHPVWADNEFRSVDTLEYGMFTLCLTNQPTQLKSSTAKESISAIQTLSSARTVSTTADREVQKKNLFIVRFTHKKLDPFRRTTTSTTLTAIRSIIIPPILRQLLRKNTLNDTPLSFTTFAASTCWKSCNPQQLNGTDRTPDTSFIESWAKPPGYNASTPRFSAPTAGTQFRRATQSGLSRLFATQLVDLDGAKSTSVSSLRALSAHASLTSGSTNSELRAASHVHENLQDTKLGHRHAFTGESAHAADTVGFHATNPRGVTDAGPSAIVSVLPAPPAETWNLTVDVDNEYFANGILVHNCDALVYGVMSLLVKIPEGLLPTAPLRAKSPAKQKLGGAGKRARRLTRRGRRNIEAA